MSPESPHLLDGYLLERDAAVRLSCSEVTLARKRRRGDGPPYVRHGRKVLYQESDLLTWLSQHRVDPAAAS